MKKTTSNSNLPKNQTTLGRFWSSTGSKESKPTNANNGYDDDDDDDDIELLAAAEAFEKTNSLPKPSSSSSIRSTPNKTTTASTTKWPISYKPGQEPKSSNEASVSAPANTNEAMHTLHQQQNGQYPTNQDKNPNHQMKHLFRHLRIQTKQCIHILISIDKLDVYGFIQQITKNVNINIKL